MNRLKLWAFALVVLAAGAANLFLVTRWLVAETVATADRELAAAVAQLDARSQLLAAQAAGLAEAAARAPAVLAALAEDGEGDPTAAAAVAVAAAARGMPPERAGSLLVGTAGPEGAQLRVSGKAAELQDPPAGIFAEPLRGTRREGYARIAGAVWFVAAVPAGKDGAVAVGLPVDAGWAAALRAATGVDVTLAAGQAHPMTTLGGDLPTVLGVSTTALPRPADAGVLPRLRTAIPLLSPLPLLTVRAPGFRVQVVALRGMRAGLAALSLPLAPRLAGVVTFQWLSVAALGLLAVAAILFGLLVSNEGPISIPRPLIAAADRVLRGDLTARVSPLAGSPGTVAAALNRALDAAEGALSPPAAPLGVPGAAPTPLTPAVIEPLRGPDPFARAAAAEPEPLPAPARPLHGEPEISAPDLFAPQRAPPPAPRSPPAYPGPTETIAGATSVATRPEDLLPGQHLVPAAPPLPAPEARDPDEPHWREVYADFCRVRQACGEPLAGLTFERFLPKLAQHREQVMRKHGCRGVIFQAYLKDGKAAIKAVPVK